MREEVDDVLALRAHDPAGLSRMITLSFAVHLGVVALAILVPREWLFKAKAPVTLMTISLGGTSGPQTTGMTPLGGRPVDQATPEPKRPEVTKPVAAKPEEITLPVKAAPPPKVQSKPTETPKPPAPTTTPPSTGRQVTTGSSRVETGAKGEGTGLALNSGGGTGGQLVPSDFCCPGYISEMVTTIKSRWEERPAGGERGEVVVRYTIQRDGRVTDVDVEKGATFLLNNASRRPFILPGPLQLKPLPAEFTDRTLTIHLTFVYK